MLCFVDIGIPSGSIRRYKCAKERITSRVLLLTPQIVPGVASLSRFFIPLQSPTSNTLDTGSTALVNGRKIYGSRRGPYLHGVVIRSRPTRPPSRLWHVVA